MRIAVISLVRSPDSWAMVVRCISDKCMVTSCNSRAQARRRTVETPMVVPYCVHRFESSFVPKQCELAVVFSFNFHLMCRFALGIPTTRAATLVTSSSTVARDRKSVIFFFIFFVIPD